MFHVQFGRLGSMIIRVLVMPMGNMSMMTGFLVIVGLVLLRRNPMVLSRLFMMFGCFQMMLGCLL
jgi:hypothetical protein